MTKERHPSLSIVPMAPQNTYQPPCLFYMASDSRRDCRKRHKPPRWKRRPDHENLLKCQFQIRPLDCIIQSVLVCKRISSSRAQSRGCRALLRRGATADALCTHPHRFLRRSAQSCGITAERSHLTKSHTKPLESRSFAAPTQSTTWIEILTVLQDFHDGVGRNLENKEHPINPFVKKGNSRSGMLGLRSEVTCAQPRFVPTSSALANQTRERIGGEASAPPRKPTTTPSSTP